jgi:hypothetical protein
MRVTQSTDQIITANVGRALYSNEVQLPMRATAALGRHPHTHWTAQSNSDQGRACSLHPEGQYSADQTRTAENPVVDDPARIVLSASVENRSPDREHAVEVGCALE